MTVGDLVYDAPRDAPMTISGFGLAGRGAGSPVLIDLE
jgi:hypothetical protein